MDTSQSPQQDRRSCRYLTLCRGVGFVHHSIFTKCQTPISRFATFSSLYDNEHVGASQVFATFDNFKRLPLSDRVSMVGLLYAMLDFERDPETFAAYDRMTAHELFIRMGACTLASSLSSLSSGGGSETCTPSLTRSAILHRAVQAPGCGLHQAHAVGGVV